MVTGLGPPTAGLIYKLVAVGGRAVAKRSPGKATVGGRKWAWRVPERAEEVVALTPAGPPGRARALQSPVVAAGVRADGPTLDEARAFHRQVLAEHPDGTAAPTGPAVRGSSSLNRQAVTSHSLMPPRMPAELSTMLTRPGGRRRGATELPPPM